MQPCPALWKLTAEPETHVVIKPSGMAIKKGSTVVAMKWGPVSLPGGVRKAPATGGLGAELWLGFESQVHGGFSPQRLAFGILPVPRLGWSGGGEH